MYSIESSIPISEQSVFIVSLELSSSIIKNPFITDSTIESSISSSFWILVQWKCIQCSSFVQIHLQLLKTLRTTVTLTFSLPCENELAEVSNVVPNLRVIQQNSSHHSIHRNSSHHSKDQWHRHMLIPKFPNLLLISSVQDLRDPFSLFCLWVRLWHFGSHFWVLWIFLCILL